jgi:hypothetical protein
MLSTITPIGERGRGHRYRTTATFFIVGAVLGGAALGLVASGLAAAVSTLAPPLAATALLAAAAALTAAASDARLAGFRLPIHRRQVNERWLDTFRPWFYGLGFGVQIGTGLTTYITTAAVYLFVTLAALTGRPAVAFASGLLFGLIRGASVLLARHVTGPDALRALHRRLHRLDPSANTLVVTTEWAAALALLALVWWPALLVAAAASVAGLVVTVARRPSTASTP